MKEKLEERYRDLRVAFVGVW